MRTPPRSPASTERKKGWECEGRVVLITRLFGGGARTREIDMISWIRSSAAKSALRAWWRAAHTHDYTSLAEMRKREQELFGAFGAFDSTGRPRGGPGLLEVTVQSHLGAEPEEYGESLSNPLNYAYFPAQEMGQQAARVAPPLDQTWSSITLRSPSNEPTEQNLYLEALRLWLTLGGVGSRTRRGAGAIAPTTREEAKKLGLPASLDELKVFLRDNCQARTVADSLAEVFCLARTRRIFLGPLQATGEAAQKKLLTVLRKARQDRPSGRSTWPEADAIRLKTDPRRAWHPELKPKNAGQYPRTALGLPIVMHFKDDPPKEPLEHHILAALPGKEPRKLERYSSPVLVRPVRVWEGNRVQYVPVALFTDCTLPADARPLVTTDQNSAPNPADIIGSYGILSHADEALRRIEKAFHDDPQFRLL